MEINIIHDLPAVTMEEPTPIIMSTENLLKPEEIYSSKNVNQKKVIILLKLLKVLFFKEE